MKIVFADTSFYIALTTPKETAHSAANSQSDTYTGQLLTTEYVVVELGNFYSKFGMRSAFIAIYDAVLQDERTTVLPCDGAILKRAVELYRTRRDKEWSLTDCTSFVVMKDYDVQEALTTDHHFRQAGFTALLSLE